MIYKTRGYRLFTIFNTIFMILIVVVMAYPYLNVLAKSLNDSTDTQLGGITIWPRVPTLFNFAALLTNNILITAFQVTIARVLLGTVTSVIVQFLAGYALAQKGLVGKKWILIFFMVPMYFSGGLIPQYLLYSQLGLLNNFLVYVLPGMFSFFNMIIIRTYVNTLPESLNESAKLDGANHWQIFIYLTVPMCVPILATVTLWSAVGHWNDWTTTLYFVTKSSLATLQYVLMEVINEANRIKQMIQEAIKLGEDLTGQNIGTTPEALRAAQVIITTIPIIMLYPFLQKYFIKGITIGAIKD